MLSVLPKSIFTKYCPPVLVAEILTSLTFPLNFSLDDFTKTLTGIPFLIETISFSETMAITCNFEAPSTLTSGIPGLAISPSFTKVLVTTPENGALIFE